jgi:hypothetical protein
MKNVMMSAMAAILVLSAGSTSASAGTLFATGSTTLYGTPFTIKQWRTGTDVGTTAFDPESLTFHNGVLYAGADEGSSSGAGRLAAYTPGAAGDLSSPSVIRSAPNGSFNWGPEGLTVNTSGVGYGSFGPGGFKLTSLDSRGTNATAGVINVDDPAVIKPLTGVQAMPESDDLTWVPSRNQFAVVLDINGAVEWFDNNMVTTGTQTPLLSEAKGITTVSATWLQTAFGLVSATPDVLAVVAEPNSALGLVNRLAFFDTNGVQLGSTINLTATGLTISNIEGIAIDQTNNLIYLADEAAISIHVISVPTPGVLGVAGLSLIAAGRRRR